MIQDDVIRTFTMDVKWTGLRMPPCQILLRAPLAQFKLFSTTICKLLSFKPQMYIHYLAIAEVPYPREGTNHWAEAVSTRMIPAHSGLSISLQHLALLTALAPCEDQRARIGQPCHELKKHLQKICSRSLYMRLHRDCTTVPMNTVHHSWVWKVPCLSLQNNRNWSTQVGPT